MYVCTHVCIICETDANIAVLFKLFMPKEGRDCTSNAMIHELCRINYCCLKTKLLQFKNSAFDTQTINRILKLELACMLDVGEAMEGS